MLHLSFTKWRNLSPFIQWNVGPTCHWHVLPGSEWSSNPRKTLPELLQSRFYSSGRNLPWTPRRWASSSECSRAGRCPGTAWRSTFWPGVCKVMEGRLHRHTGSLGNILKIWRDEIFKPVPPKGTMKLSAKSLLQPSQWFSMWRTRRSVRFEPDYVLITNNFPFTRQFLCLVYLLPPAIREKH